MVTATDTEYVPLANLLFAKKLGAIRRQYNGKGEAMKARLFTAFVLAVGLALLVPVRPGRTYRITAYYQPQYQRLLRRRDRGGSRLAVSDQCWSKSSFRAIRCTSGGFL